MKASQRSLMNQIRRALFQEEEEEHEILEATTHENGSENPFTNITNTKTRRGQRQKWKQPKDESAAVNKKSSDCLQVSSLVANTEPSTSKSAILMQSTSNRGRTSGQAMSVLANLDATSVRNSSSGDDNDSVSSSSSSEESDSPRMTAHAGGLLTLFGAMPTARKEPRQQSTRRVQRKSQPTATAGGLFGAVGMNGAETKSRRDNAKLPARGKRGRTKNVSWANESSLVLATNAFSRVEESGTDSGGKQHRDARKGSESSGSLGGATSTQLSNEEAGPSNVTSEDRIIASRKTMAVLSEDHIGESLDTLENSPFDHDGDMLIEEDSPLAPITEVEPPGSATKPTKRKNTRQTPEKLDVDDSPCAEMDESISFSNESRPPVEAEKAEARVPAPVLASSPPVPSSRVLEVEYIPPPSVVMKALARQPVVDVLEMETRRMSISDEPAPSASSAVDVLEQETRRLSLAASSAHVPSQSNPSPQQEMRRSRRRAIPTDIFSPSVAMKQAQYATNRSAQDGENGSTPMQTLSPSSAPMDTDEEEEPVVQRRSARSRIPTDRLSPSVAMKQAQSKPGKPSKDKKRNKTKPKTKSILKNKGGSGRPPRAAAPTKPLSESDTVTTEQDEDTNEHQHSTDYVSNGEVVETNTTQIDEWTDEQLAQLKHSHAQVDPTSPSFWDDIAECVNGRSSQECRDKWFSLVKTPAPRARKTRKDTKIDGPVADVAPDVQEDDEDDIFNSTPMRGFLFPPTNERSSADSDDEMDIDYDVGSPVAMSVRRDRRVSSEYDDGNENETFQHKVGYKSYMMGLKRGVAKAIQEEKKATKSKKDARVKDGTRTFTESVGNGDVSLKGHLSPGGTLKVKNLNEDEDDFLDYLSEPSGCED